MAKKSDTSLDAADNEETQTAIETVDVADDGLVEVSKGSETLRVHPTCVKAHAEAGWK